MSTDQQTKSGMGGKIALGVGLVLLLMVLGVFMTGLSKARQANGLEETLKQEEQTYANKLEKITRVIAGKYQIAQQYPEQLKDVVSALAKPREGGSVFKSVTEQNTNVFSPDMLKDVQQAVDSQRSEFEYAFKGYADHAREYNTLVRDPLWGSKGFLGSMFMGSREPVYPEPIMSSRTAEAQKTRRDDRSDFDSDFKAKPSGGMGGLGKAKE